MTKKERKLVLLIGIGALLLFTFTDLHISQDICRKQFPARVLEVIGEIPFTVLVLSGCGILIRFRDRETLWKNLLTTAGIGILFLLFTFMGGFMTWNYLSRNLSHVPKLLILLIGVLMAAAALVIAGKVPEEKKRQAVSFAVTALLYFVLVLIVMNSLKTVWGRMRFREMTEPLSQFTPWYQICGRGSFSDVYASFPSGHSMNSAGVVLLLLFPGFMPGLEGKEKFIRIAVYTWTILVGSSRVMMGAHFASDVTVGILLSFMLFEVTRTVVFKIRREKKQYG